jgi:hypothetical protein
VILLHLIVRIYSFRSIIQRCSNFWIHKCHKWMTPYKWHPNTHLLSKQLCFISLKDVKFLRTFCLNYEIIILFISNHRCSHHNLHISVFSQVTANREKIYDLLNHFAFVSRSQKTVFSSLNLKQIVHIRKKYSYTATNLRWKLFCK